MSRIFEGSSQGGNLNYWPTLIDLLAATLLVFLLTSYLQATLSMDLETLRIQERQERFIEQFDAMFHQERQRDTVAVKRSLESIQITFSEGVLFDSGKYRLKPQGVQLIRRLAVLLTQTEETTRYRWVQVEGHTDDRPLRSSEYPHNNWQLSAARAISVVEQLSAPGRLSPERLSANGYAFYRPVASNEDEKGRASNRRIEIRLFFTDAGRSELKAPGNPP